VDGSRLPGKDHGRCVRRCDPSRANGYTCTQSFASRISHLPIKPLPSFLIPAVVNVGGKHSMLVPATVRDCINWI